MPRSLTGSCAAFKREALLSRTFLGRFKQCQSNRLSSSAMYFESFRLVFSSLPLVLVDSFQSPVDLRSPTSFRSYFRFATRSFALPRTHLRHVNRLRPSSRFFPAAPRSAQSTPAPTYLPASPYACTAPRTRVYTRAQPSETLIFREIISPRKAAPAGCHGRARGETRELSNGRGTRGFLGADRGFYAL